MQTCEVLEPSSSISVDQYLCVCVFACVPLDLVGCGSVGVGVGMGGGQQTTRWTKQPLSRLQYRSVISEVSGLVSRQSRGFLIGPRTSLREHNDPGQPRGQLLVLKLIVPQSLAMSQHINVKMGDKPLLKTLRGISNQITGPLISSLQPPTPTTQSKGCV